MAAIDKSTASDPHPAQVVPARTPRCGGAGRDRLAQVRRSAEAEQGCDCAPGALASSRPSASSPVPAVGRVPALFASFACLGVPALSACPDTSAPLARPGVPALLASLHVSASLTRPGVPASLNASASAPVPALSACPHAPASSRHVGAGSTIAPKAEQPSEHAPAGHQSRNVKQGKVGKMRNGDVNGSFPTTYAEDRDGNSRASSFCLLRPRTRRKCLRNNDIPRAAMDAARHDTRSPRRK